MSKATTSKGTEARVHAFEEAGLGKAPFRCTGVERRVGPIDLGNGFSAGAPGQPMGSCDYCGTGIAECYHIVGADGRDFVVGCECVRKAGEAGLLQAKVVREYKRQQREAKAAAQREADKARIAELLADRELRERLHALPHPNSYLATSRRLTRLDWAEWMLQHAGASGLRAVARALEGDANQAPSTHAGAGPADAEEARCEAMALRRRGAWRGNEDA